MKQPKWITKMEFIDAWEPGYWVQRGWDKDAFVRTTSVIDVVATANVYTVNGTKMVPIGGMAWSGARGISKVEVKVDDGAWTSVQLRKPPLSDKTWILWRYDWPFTAGLHTFYVRCAEADGTPQIETDADVEWSGATGIDSVTATL
jgi:hypothetical protein